MGFVLGMVIGLAAALSVAVYVTKVPVPFVSKAPVSYTHLTLPTNREV